MNAMNQVEGGSMANPTYSPTELSTMEDELEKLREQIALNRQEHTKLVAEIIELNQSLTRANNENDLLKSFIENEKAKTGQCLAKFNLELSHEERMVRSYSILQKNFERLCVKYDTLACSPLGRLMLYIWSVYNKIVRGSRSG